MEEFKEIILMLLEDYKSMLEAEVIYERGIIKANAEIQLRLVQETIIQLRRL